MMYLTRMELDVTKRNTMKALVSPNLIHGAVETAFRGERTRKLWRIDNIGTHCYLLILSEDKPNLENAARQFGIDDDGHEWLTKDYDNLINRIENGGEWRFRLTANPTHSVRDGKGGRGVIHAHITPKHQKEWLMERSEKNGFALSENNFDVVGSGWQKFYKGEQRKNPVTILAVTYEGILTVTDKEKFKNLLTEGIGREKAYGMGMLTVVKAGENQ